MRRLLASSLVALTLSAFSVSFITRHDNTSGGASSFGVATLSAATRCENLKTFALLRDRGLVRNPGDPIALPTMTIITAESIAAGAFTPPPPANGRARGGGRGPAVNPYADVPAFCRVTARLTPYPYADIQMELWMPESGWNGKYQTGGNGGYAGNIGQNGLAAAVKRGYAMAITDTGHTGGAASMAGNPEKMIDFAHRALHETTVKGKALVAAFYGSGPKYSYFNACSTGGRQALMEASKYPDDFNGIVAGDPAIWTSHQAAQQLWVGMAVHRDEASFIQPEKFPAIHKAAVDACDALDGVKDGVLENPRRCTFDPRVIECKGEANNNCLTAPQVEAARKLYQSPINPRTKEAVFAPLERGSELGWGGMAGPMPFGYANDFYKVFVKKDPNWDYKTLDFDKDVAQAEKEWDGVFDYFHANLKPFFDRGGKLIQYHGWADPLITPGVSIDYYNNVVKTMGGVSRIDDKLRLFMIPGMAHCGGGEGTSTFDMLTAIEQWVENGKAPETIPASKVVDGQVVRTRPLCQYPKEAVYKGTGGTDEATSFECRKR